MTKTALRKKYKELRAQMDPESLDDRSMDIANQCLSIPIWERSFYHVFLPIHKQKEVNTEFILHILQGKDKNVVISKSNFEDLTMEHFLLTDTTALKVNSYGIPEPVDAIPIPVEKIEVVFVPLLAYDKSGNRVGYGKGFYDHFLSQCHSSTIKIGLSFFKAEDAIAYISPMDVSLDYCVTPDTVYEF